jgi:NAD(P)-dependent dehydrogenase (short-subunit alcohol dehydrogenase family)
VTFVGKVALVTGGASGIGRATAVHLAAEGAAVVVADRQPLTGLAGVDSSTVDVTEEDAVEALVATIVARHGRLDVAVNAAGVPSTYAKTSECPTDVWHSTLAVNLTGVFFCLRAELRAMTAQDPPGGAVVNVSSAAGLMGTPGMPAYVASKHGVVGLTKTAALEVVRRGIRVNAVCPGAVRTPMLAGFVGNDEETLAGLGRAQPIGRLADPDEIAAAIVWLCSDAASYVTGAAVPVDGGVLAT